MKHHLRFVIFAAALSAAFTLQACNRSLFAANIAGNYVNNFNGDKTTLNPDGTGFVLTTSEQRFEIKYHVENNKVFMQSYQGTSSSPVHISDTTYERENNGNLCINNVPFVGKACEVKQ